MFVCTSVPSPQALQSRLEGLLAMHNALLQYQTSRTMPQSTLIVKGDEEATPSPTTPPATRPAAPLKEVPTLDD